MSLFYEDNIFSIKLISHMVLDNIKQQIIYTMITMYINKDELYVYMQGLKNLMQCLIKISIWKNSLDLRIKVEYIQNISIAREKLCKT